MRYYFQLEFFFCIIYSILFFTNANSEGLQNEENGNKQADLADNLNYESTKSSEDQYKNIAQMYAKLFKKKRASHLEAISVLSRLDIQKQSKTIEMLFNKLFDVLNENEVKLMSNGYVPGNIFPETENLLDAFSMTIENTFFLGEICLRFPDISHKLVDSNREWMRLARWGIDFSNETRIFDHLKDGAILSLMAQELNLIERLPNFVNPFRNTLKDNLLLDQKSQSNKLLPKAKKEKKSKGPRMSHNRNDL